MSDAAPLLADVGGTNARFALAATVEPDSWPYVELPSAGFRDLAGAVRVALERLDGAPRTVRTLAVAVAGPVDGDEIELTNTDWRFSIAATRKALGLDRLIVVNDLVAYGWALPSLGEPDLEVLSAGEGDVRGTAGVVAVGTGLGVATVVTAPFAVVASEGGHADLAAGDEREWEVRRRLEARFGAHVSWERAVSGSGLENLWRALAELDGEPLGTSPAGREIAASAAGGDRRCREVLSLFSGWLGAFAGDLALTVTARRGIYLSGGVLAGDAVTLDLERFRERFVAKGRFRSWLESVPVRRIVAERVALRGLARLAAA